MELGVGKPVEDMETEVLRGHGMIIGSIELVWVIGKLADYIPD